MSASQNQNSSNSADCINEEQSTIWKACAYGDFEQLQRCLHEQPDLVNKADDQGYLPLQWAALNNQAPCCTLLLEQGAIAGARDSVGQTALHWAAVRGSLSAAEQLLRAGAALSARDNRKYTVCHVAAQYGQTAFLYHVAMRWAADVDETDADGRTPLHWAAYKGFADSVRLLLVLDARWALPDSEGCTPLHWGAIKDSGDACIQLLQAGADSLLLTKDNTGSTPAQLAVEKGHRHLGISLADYRSARREALEAETPCPGVEIMCGKLGYLAPVTQTQLAPMVWAIIIGLVAMFLTKVVWEPSLGSPAQPVMTVSAVAVVLLASIGLWLLYRVTVTDPGFLPRGPGAAPLQNTKNDTYRRDSDASGGTHRLLNSPALWAGQWQQLCVSCRIVRPLRAKHDPITDRCVDAFDHFCPWVGNAIGRQNRHLFLVFLWVEAAAMIVALVATCLRIHRLYASSENFPSGGPGWMIAFVCLDSFMLFSVLALAISQASQVARNVTTNELINWTKYPYMRDAAGRFSNRFDKGLRSNCVDAFNPSAFTDLPCYMAEGETETMSLLRMEQQQLFKNPADLNLQTNASYTQLDV